MVFKPLEGLLRDVEVSLDPRMLGKYIKMTHLFSCMKFEVSFLGPLRALPTEGSLKSWRSIVPSPWASESEAGVGSPASGGEH